MKTAIQQLVDIMNEDQVSFTEWFQDNYQMYIEKEKEQIMNAFSRGLGTELGLDWEDSEQYYERIYNQTYNQNK